MNKKHILAASIAALTLASCDYHDYNFGDNEGANWNPTQVNVHNITLSDANYEAIARDESNIERATNDGVLDQLNAVANNKCFNEDIAAMDYIQPILKNLVGDAQYYTMTAGSIINVTYSQEKEMPAYLQNLDGIPTVELTENTYTPKTLSKLSDDLKTALPSAASGDIVVVNFPYSEVELPEGEEKPVQEPGNGTIDNPFTVAEALAMITALSESDVIENVYTKGKISEVVKQGKSGSIQIKISDNGASENSLLVYYCDGFNKVPFTALTDLSVGDEVVICGKVKNYKGTTPEYDSGTFLIERNGEITPGDGTMANPYKASTALEFIKGLTSEEVVENVYTRGTICNVKKIGTSGSIQFYLSDNGVDENSLMVYYCNGLNNVPFTSLEDLKVGDKVVLVGKVKNYKGTTPEYDSGTILVSLNGETAYPEAVEEAAARSMSIISKKAYNKSLVYTCNGSSWSKYEETGVTIEAIDPSAYASIGSESISNPDVTLPQYLANTFPYAEADKVVALVYNNGKENTVAEYTFDGEAWNKTTDRENQTVSYSLDSDGWAAKGDYLNQTLMSLASTDAAAIYDAYGWTVEYVGGLPSSLTYVWSATTGYGMKASAYASKTNNATDSWIISPSMNLKKAKNPVFTFDEAQKYAGEPLSDFLQIWVSTDFTVDGGQAAAHWTNVTDKLKGERPDGSSWDFKSMSLDMSEYNGNKNVVVAFRYVSTSDYAPTWEFKNVICREAEETEE